MKMTVSFFWWHRRQSEFPCDLSILTFTALVLSALLWAATSNSVVSFLRYPLLSHDRPLFSLSISSISIRNCSTFLLLTSSVFSLPFRLLISLDSSIIHFMFPPAADNILSMLSDTYLARLALDSSTAFKPGPPPFLGR